MPNMATLGNITGYATMGRGKKVIKYMGLYCVTGSDPLP